MAVVPVLKKRPHGKLHAEILSSSVAAKSLSSSKQCERKGSTMKKRNLVFMTQLFTLPSDQDKFCA